LFFNFWFISKLVGRSHQSSRCPGKRAGAEDKKGRDQAFPFSFLFLSAKRRGGKGIARQQGAEARIGERGTTAFFGEANALLPGHGTTWPYGKSSVHRTDSKYGFFRKKTGFLLN